MLVSSYNLRAASIMVPKPKASGFWVLVVGAFSLRMPIEPIGLMFIYLLPPI
jgi:hypothetical protein